MTLRNRNYLRAAWFSLGVALVILAINLPSSFALGWLGITLVVIPGTTAILSLAVWWRSSLRVRADGVTIGSLLHQHVCGWDAIQSFEIRAPEDRGTPFLLMFRPSADQARARLRDGRVVRVPAVQPPHDFKPVFIDPIWKPGAADELVRGLNTLKELLGEKAA